MTIAVALLTALAACAGGDVSRIGRDTYRVARRSVEAGLGPPVEATAYVYDKANDYCSDRGRVVQTVKLDQVDPTPGHPASVTLTFRCIFSIAPL